ncbi:hypothetical protein [Acinetobacter sp.]|uniref:hypothetical protein n=1 Tax=Acinetobacter sp. TaxID=472 RepID=UPI00388DB719
MSIVIFYLSGPIPECLHFKDTQLTEALVECQNLRNNGYTHVTISSQFDDHVGKPGVDSVQDGKTPDGHDYQWSKAHRAGASRK